MVGVLQTSVADPVQLFTGSYGDMPFYYIFLPDLNIIVTLTIKDLNIVCPKQYILFRQHYLTRKIVLPGSVCGLRIWILLLSDQDSGEKDRILSDPDTGDPKSSGSVALQEAIGGKEQVQEGAQGN